MPNYINISIIEKGGIYHVSAFSTIATRVTEHRIKEFLFADRACEVLSKSESTIGTLFQIEIVLKSPY